LSALSEVEFLKQLDHPNIIHIIEYFIEPNFLYIIFEDMPGGRILSELAKTKKGVDLEDVVDIMRQVFTAMEFCRKRKIAHRALGPDNVLLARIKERFVVKVIDWSQAVVVDQPEMKPI
jgi:serine/threonine protein kinase